MRKREELVKENNKLLGENIDLKSKLGLEKLKNRELEMTVKFLEEENEQLKKEVTELKSKYADEVQKRWNMAMNLVYTERNVGICKEKK